MPAKKEKEMSDVIIIGGGIVGGALACALAEQGMRISLVDQHGPDSTQPSDGRSFALSHSSYLLFSKLGIWQELGEVSAISSIHTSDGMLPRWLDFHEDDLEKGPLGYVVDSALLKAKVWDKVRSFENIILHAPTKLKTLERGECKVSAQTEEGTLINAPLCVAADGRFSSVRQEANIPLLEWKYRQVALVCNMAHSRPHMNQAFEHFLPLGPLAFVPRLGQESGLVWSLDKEKADVLLALPPHEFAEEVQAQFGDVLGELKLTSERRAFPLGVCLPKTLIEKRLALVGDAAHLMHPVAGQGLNVGLRDVSALAEVLGEAFSLGLDLGAETTLRTYQQKRRLDIFSMAFLTDGIVRIFSNKSKTVARMRSLGFGAAKNVRPLKHFMIRRAMGL